MYYFSATRYYSRELAILFHKKPLVVLRVIDVTRCLVVDSIANSIVAELAQRIDIRHGGNNFHGIFQKRATFS